MRCLTCMSARSFHRVVLLIACLFAAPGCATTPTRTTTHKGYSGPTEPIAQVISDINTNNGELPTLWARHYFEATIVDDKKQSHFVNGDGALLFRRPQHMLLVGTKPGAGRVFEIGSTPENYWLKIVPEVDTTWWGKYENLGKPCVQKVPIAPDQVFEVLGVSTFNTDLTQLPAPVMRFNNDADAYMFVWVARLPDRYAAMKEVWYDRQTKLPKLVILFDENGRVQLRAYLSKHQPVEVPDVPRERWPKVATNYDLYFPETGTKMRFELSDMTLDKNGVPSRKGIVFPGATPEEAGTAKVIQLDAPCDSK